MSLDTYANLKTTIQNWSRRNDIPAHVDDVIDLCEAEIYNNSQSPLKVREMEVRATATAPTSDRYIALPTGFLEMRRLSLITGGQDIDIVHTTPESMRINEAAGRPDYFTVTSQIEFDRIPDSAYTLEMLYYKKPTALSSSNTTNDVLTNYPNVYLWGCRWATYVYAGEDEKAEMDYQRFVRAIKGANKQSKAGRFGPSPARRSERMTP